MGLIAYALAFLRQPLIEGATGEAVQALTRGGFVLSVLVYPEAIVQSWTDAGRLPIGFGDRLPIALATSLWLALAALAGWPWAARLMGNDESGPTHSTGSAQLPIAWRLHRMAWSMLIGLAWLSTATLVVGLAGLLAATEPVHMPLRTPLVVACGGVVILSWLTAQWRIKFDSRAHASKTSQVASDHTIEVDSSPMSGYDEPAVGLLDRGLGMLTRLLVIWLAIVTMLGAWVPSAEFDVLEYHLQAPREFFELGAIRFVPHNIYANMPLGIEMHTLAAMTLTGLHDAWWSGLIGKSITASFSLIGAVLLGSYFASRGTGRGHAQSGWCAAGVWLASPGIAHVAQLGLIDGAVATYVLATCMAASNAYRASLGNSSSKPDWGKLDWWFVASIMAGAAAAAKYPGLIFAAMPLMAVWLAAGWQIRSRATADDKSTRNGLRGSMAQLLIMSVGLATTCVPWYVKNAVLIGNPFYPLAASIFGGQTLTSEKIAQWQAAHRVPGTWSESLPRLLSDTWRLLVASPFVQPAMVIGFLVAGVWIIKHRKSSSSAWPIWLAWSLWILVVWWCFTHRIDRFWLPWTGLAAGLATLGVSWIAERSRSLAHVLIVCSVGYGGLVNSSSVVSDNRYFVALDALRSDAGDQEQVGRISHHMAWIHTNLRDTNARLLMIGEAAVFEYQLPFLYSTCFDTNPAEPLLRDKPLEDQRRELERLSITHLLINWREIERYRSPGNYGFSDWPTRADIAALESSGLIRRIDMQTQSAELYEVVR